MSALGAQGSRSGRLGRYELITRIGEGGMAEVQLALQRGPAGFEKLVVIKLVHENLTAQKDFVDMLLDEARVAALVKHPNVVDIYDLGEAEGRFFIAMEYLEGEPLLAVLRAGRDGKRLDILSTARLIADTAEGLDAAHELRSMGGEALELVHHDVSLGNIVVLYNGQVKLVDFGVAKATQSVSQNRRVQGKFSYMAPEKLRGGSGDRRSDIWSLGCVLWEALTLKRLFKGGNDSDTMRQVLESEIPLPSQINGEVVPDFDPIVMRALQRDPAQRYATAKAMAADLEEVLRTHHYGGKNDKIAKYMQATFDAHIAARKKLLQEVSSKGRASSEVLEAAFNDPRLASGSPVATGDFSMRYRRATSELQAEGTPSRRSDPGVPSVPVPVIEYPRAATGDLPRVLLPPPDDAPTVLDRPITPEPAPRVLDRRRVTIALGGLVAIAIVVVLVARRGCGSDHGAPAGGASTARPAAIAPDIATRAAAGIDAEEPRARTARSDEGAPEEAWARTTRSDAGAPQAPPARTAQIDEHAPEAPPARTARSDAGAPQAPPARTARSDAGAPQAPPARTARSDEHAPGALPADAAQPATVGSADSDVDQIELPPDPVKRSPPPRPVEKVDAVTLTKSGIQAFLHGDTKGAVALFKRSLQLNPAYAHTWRALGAAQEKLGEPTAAKAAYQRYLTLMPNASDATLIRAKLDRL